MLATGGGALTLASAFLASDGFGGDNIGTSGASGTGTGGSGSILAEAGSILSISGDAEVLASGYGGGLDTGTAGGGAFGGSASIGADGSTVPIGGDAQAHTTRFADTNITRSEEHGVG